MNNIQTIPTDAFIGLVSLRSLDLSHNQLKKIDNKTNGVLDDCLSLEKVSIYANMLISIGLNFQHSIFNDSIIAFLFFLFF